MPDQLFFFRVRVTYTYERELRGVDPFEQRAQAFGLVCAANAQQAKKVFLAELYVLSPGATVLRQSARKVRLKCGQVLNIEQRDCS